jgi:4Fe-4S ferredoxin
MAKTKTSAEKARRAAVHPKRPGLECHAEPGTFAPRVDRARCEGKSDCVEVCPYSVFEVRTMDAADFQELSLLGKLRSIAHGRKTAYTVNAARCQACGLCVVACPEQAIRLESAPPQA